MMNIRTLGKAISLIGVLAVTGCESDVTERDEKPVNSAPMNDVQDALPNSAVTAMDSELPDSWELYIPPQKDFSVKAPKSVEVKENESKVGIFRTYVFKKGEGFCSIEIHSDRKAPLNENSVEELKSDTSDYVPGSVQEISLGDMQGLEFRMKGAIGESIFREYCAPDNSRTISIQVAKDHGERFTEEEVNLFLDSFKLLD